MNGQSPTSTRRHSGTPQPEDLIAFEWCGTVFTGRFIEATKPWGVAWLVDFRYFSIFSRPRFVPRNKIAWWAPADSD